MNRQQKIVIAGAIVGGALGAAGGFLFSRGVEESGRRLGDLSAQSLPTGEIVRLIISIMGVLRSVAELGQRA
jgi:hypothetical protein